jgi:thioester reductase-like protein
MIFLTGSTGFLGRELLARLLLRTPDRFALLVRPATGVESAKRIEQILGGLFPQGVAARFADRIEIVEGDIALENFGLGASQFDDLARRTSTVFHSAASTALNSTVEEARPINVTGTANVLDLADRAFQSHGAPISFFHISTAYVAGDCDQVVKPHELRLDGPFRNGYEHSKAESEALVRNSRSIKATIFRPSIIVGDSVTGETSAFNVVYVPAKFISKGLFRALPGIPSTPFDIVPVDYVADAIIELSLRHQEGGAAYHLSVGVGRETTPHEILEFIIQTYNRFYAQRKTLLGVPLFLSPDLVSRGLTAAMHGVERVEKMFSHQIGVLRQVLPFVPYMTSNPRFDTSNTVADLGNILAAPPLFKTYAERLFEYCFHTNWGRRPWTNPHNHDSWLDRYMLSMAPRAIQSI